MDVESNTAFAVTKGPNSSSRMQRAWKFFTQIFHSLLPSWLRPQDAVNSHRVKHSTSTMYLDGLRGIAAFMVFVEHFSLPWQPHLGYGYGYRGYNGFLRLPFARLVFSAPLVPVFFVISGYVLSAKTLKLSRAGHWEPLLLSLSASVFRRSIRLFLPPIISTFFVAVLAHYGFFSFPYDSMPGRRPAHPQQQSSIYIQISEWSDFVSQELTNPWRWDIPALAYGPHLWTIPITFKGSLVVFLVCLGIARVKTSIRFYLLMVLSIYTLLYSRWDMASFLHGILLCELITSQLSFNQPMIQNPSPRKSRKSRLRRVGYISILVAGLFIGSFPKYNANGKACVVGYSWLCSLTSDYHYWHGLGAFFITLAASQEELLQWPLRSPIIQYLGSISFSMYIIHEPFLHCFAFRLVPFFWELTGKESVVQYQTGFVLGMVTSAAILIWLADLFKEYVEEPCSRLAGRIESLVFVS